MSLEYVFILGVILLAVWMNFVSDRSIVTRIIFIVSVIFIIACAGLRNESVGRDYIIYREYYQLCPAPFGRMFLSQWAETLPNVDIGWVFLNSILKTVGSPFEVLIFVVAALAVGLMSLFYYKNTKFYSLALLLYYSHAFFYREMIQIRAGLACVLLLWSFHCFSRNDKILGYFVFLISCTIHISAFIAILPIMAFNIEWKPGLKFVVISIGVAIVLGNLITSSLPIFSLLDRLAVYQDTEYSRSLGIFTNPVTIKQIALVLMAWWLMRIRGAGIFSPVFRLCLISYLFSTLWIISFNEFEILGARGASFLSMGEPLLLAEIVGLVFKDHTFRRYKRLAAIGVIGFALTMLVLNLDVKVVVNDYRTIFWQN